MPGFSEELCQSYRKAALGIHYPVKWQGLFTSLSKELLFLDWKRWTGLRKSQKPRTVMALLLFKFLKVEPRPILFPKSSCKILSVMQHNHEWATRADSRILRDILLCKNNSWYPQVTNSKALQSFLKTKTSKIITLNISQMNVGKKKNKALKVTNQIHKGKQKNSSS